MDTDPVAPLRITKGVSNSPFKMGRSAIPRPLGEVNPMGIRRNSGGPNAQTIESHQPVFKRDSSPFDPVPGATSPHSFWKNRESVSPSRLGNENAPPRRTSPSPIRRSSIENLKKASRVTNNNMFTREADQEDVFEQPGLVYKYDNSARPMGLRAQPNGWGHGNVQGLQNQLGAFRGHRKVESDTKIPRLSQTSPATEIVSRPPSPLKDQVSPPKSSLSSNSRYMAANEFASANGLSPVDDNDDEGGSDLHESTPRAILRQPKSVSFDIAPPQINEYESVTPDPSSIASGSREGSYDDLYDMDHEFEGEVSLDQDDSFAESLEDADKTPVVLPEDWRFMSPEVANTGLADTFDDPFEGRRSGTPSSARKGASAGNEITIARSSSVRSNGEHRPLPPLPGVPTAPIDQVSPAVETRSLSKTYRSKPHPPRASSVSKEEIRSMRESPMPLDERLRLLSIQNQEAESKQDKGSDRPKSTAPPIERRRDSHGSGSSVDDRSLKTEGIVFQAPSRISRDSILRKVHDQQLRSLEFGDSSVSLDQMHEEEFSQYANLDPDIPIPSRESSSSYEDDDALDVIIKKEDEDSDAEDTFTMPDAVDAENSPSLVGGYTHESSIIHHALHFDNKDQEQDIEDNLITSLATDAPSADLATRNVDSNHPVESTKISRTGTSNLPWNVQGAQLESRDRPVGLDLPNFTSFMGSDDFGLGFQNYLSLSPPEEDGRPTAKNEPEKEDKDLRTQRPLTPTRLLEPIEAFTPVSYDEDIGTLREEGTITPDSVIHHTTDTVSAQYDDPVEYPIVPEPVATIKAAGSKLKTRPSATPADLRAMAAARRHVSGEKPLPLLPHEEGDEEDDYDDEGSETEDEYLEHGEESAPASVKERDNTDMKLEVPLDESADELGVGLEKAFDRVIEAQKVQTSPFPSRDVKRKDAAASSANAMPTSTFPDQRNITDLYTPKQRGYLMRQNTKVVVASTRQVSEETKNGASLPENAQSGPGRRRRPSGKSWKAEPWNGNTRRQSTRRSNIVPERRMKVAATPPLPGTESVVLEAPDTLAEEQLSFEDDNLEGAERGRLFVKVVGIKDLELPLPKDERCFFQLTLDNGLHCVTTNWAELGRNAPIGQEFELVVFDDLEFQLTLQTRLQRPKSAPSILSSTVAPSFKLSKTSTLTRLLTSPRKRREQEQKQRAEEAQATLQRQQNLELHRANHRPTAWDLQNELVGPDGSFARAYVSLSSHERQAYGRPCKVDVPCFNEWAMEDKTIASSTRSKLGGIQRRPPYKIGKIELQLLYIPKPRGVNDEDMPKSISAAVRELDEAENAVETQFEGHLSQQGGDCPYWRRRFFKLEGSRLIAFHEITRQRRATIDLARATKLIDDRSSLTQVDPTASPTKTGGRRKSAFSDEEGYMFVEEGFRIRFANGESIDFYADSPQQKEQWMRVLSETVGNKGAATKVTWMNAVLARERSMSARKTNQLQDEKLPVRGGSRSAPTSPVRKPVGTGAKGNTAAAAPKLPPTAERSHWQLCSSSPSKPHDTLSKRQNEQPSPRVAKQFSKRQAIKSMIF